MHKLILYHSTRCNPDYLYGHISIAYKLTRRIITTYAEYTKEAAEQGVSHYSEELFNDFISKTN